MWHTYVDEKYIQKILYEKLKGSITWRTRHRWEDNIKTDALNK